MNINFVSNKIKSLVGHPIYRIMSASVAEKANTNERTYKRTYVQSAADLVNENQSASESLTTHAKHSFSVITIEGVLIQGKMIHIMKFLFDQFSVNLREFLVEQ